MKLYRVNTIGIRPSNTYKKLGYTTSHVDACVRYKKEKGGHIKMSQHILIFYRSIKLTP